MVKRKTNWELEFHFLCFFEIGSCLAIILVLVFQTSLKKFELTRHYHFSVFFRGASVHCCNFSWYQIWTKDLQQSTDLMPEKQYHAAKEEAEWITPFLPTDELYERQFFFTRALLAWGINKCWLPNHEINCKLGVRSIFCTFWAYTQHNYRKKKHKLDN